MGQEDEMIHRFKIHMEIEEENEVGFIEFNLKLWNFNEEFDIEAPSEYLTMDEVNEMFGYTITPLPIESGETNSTSGYYHNLVGELINVPDELPTVTTIVDIIALQNSDSDFYKDAQNGDIVLIYTSLAVIYRESENKVINQQIIAYD